MTDNPYVTLIVFAVLIAMCMGVSIMAVLLWLGNARVGGIAEKSFAAALTTDEEKARAMVRGVPGVGLACWGLALGLLLILLDEFSRGSGLDTGIEWLGVGGGLAILFIGVGLDLAVTRYNRPKFVVPPHLRWEPGYNEVVRARDQGQDLDEFYRAARENWESRRLSRG